MISFIEKTSSLQNRKFTNRTYLQNLKWFGPFHRTSTQQEEENRQYIQQYRDVCAICLEEFCYGNVVKILPCKHVFHVDCLDPWCLKQNASCPICKRHFTKDGMEPFDRSALDAELVTALRRGEGKEDDD